MEESQKTNSNALTSLLNTVERYIPKERIATHSGNTDSTVSIIDKENDVAFEVFENEIIIFFFTDHKHFEDYSFTKGNDEPDYISRAVTFLEMLFNCTIVNEKIYKGKRLKKETYSLILPDGTAETLNTIIHIGLRGFLSFGKKRFERNFWRFDREKQQFKLTFDSI